MANLITGFGPRKGPSPTGENVVARNPRWGTCLYCYLEQEREVKLLQSPVIGGGIKCPGCGRRWRDADQYNADIKGVVERAAREAPELLDKPTKEEVATQIAWDAKMAESVRKHKASLPSDWTPYVHREDAPIVLGVQGMKDGKDSKEEG